MKTLKGVRVIATVFFITSCLIISCRQEVKTKADSAFKAYISSFTSGTISKEGTVRVSLQNDVAKAEEINTVIAKNIFEFTPAIKGSAVWIDSRTIEFRPSEILKSGATYNASFLLSGVMKVPQKFSKFLFDFKVIAPSFEVIVEGLRPLDNRNFNRQYLIGNVGTADVEEPNSVEKILTALQNDKALPITWTHSADRLVHSFRVDSIERSDDSSSVKLAWDGKAISVPLTGERLVTVPALGDFTITNTRVVQQETEQYLLIEFSDPLLENQNLQGLITLGGMTDMKFTIEDNTIRVYPSSRQTTTLTLVVDAAVKNGLGKNMKQEVRQNITFEEIKPAVRLVGKGVILPSSNGLVFPFEAVNLSSVDVNIVKIFGDNTSQFLQVNNLDGENEMARVGRSVLKKTIALSTIRKTDFTKWNRFTLDLSDLIKADPGCIYRVTLSFKKKYSLYKCTEADTSKAAPDADEESSWDENEPKEASSWDYAEEYYEGDGDGDYEWRDRDNPCKNSYYTSSRWASRNVLASDLGLIAKKGMEGSMVFAVTDLKTTQPVNGVTLEIYNYQQQLIDKKETGNDGMAQVTLSQKPFLLIAKKGDQRGYLKLDDGSSLSLSMFDVAGEKVQKGLKGFIYGERGVWRPGDSLFVTFMLEDKQHSLPEAHPVTFELYNPQGQLAKKIVRTESMNGFYSFITATDEEAPTGSWEAKVKVGSATFTKTIRIESIMPNRLKIKFDFAKKYLEKDDNQSAKMEVKWLHGAVARNLKADVEVTLTSSKTMFPKYSEYNFDDPTRKFSADKQQLFEGNVDENGKATIDANIEVEDAAPGMLMANFVTKVFEPGGNFSIDRFSIPYHPYDEYVGVRVPKGDKARGMLLTDTNHIVQIVAVDKNGNPVAAKRKIEIEFYQVQWKWWWDKSEEDLSNFSSSTFNRFLQRDTVSTTNGIANWTLRLNYPSWGRYLLRVHDLESGHYSGKVFYMDWPGWAGRGQRENQGSATMLSFSSDKDKYIVGDQVKLSFPSGKNSRALFSIESGTKTIKSYWAEGKEGETQFSFPATPDMSPNVYVNITLLQPHSQTVNDLPIRMYGVLPILVENPGTHIKPVIKMPNVLRPEEPVSIAVKEEQGKSMTYTLAVVDEGLLDLTRFQTPDPWNNFYAREALGVKTWDMFDYVMGAWGAEMERMLNIGGDEGIAKPKEGSKANRFKPVVKFMGPFHLAKGETQTHTFTMPQYVGSVRTMVVAGEDGAYGFAEKATPVRKPLMVLATLPRVLGPDEAVDLPVTVFAMEKNVKDVTVEIITSNLLMVDGESKKTIKFAQPGDDVITFKLKVKPLLGIGKVRVVALSGKEKSETSIELDVRNPNPMVTEVKDTLLEAGQSWQTNYKTAGMSGTNKGTLELSSVPPLNLGKRLDYLIHYPYGCVEQTTSSVFPQLFLADLMELSPDKKSAIEKNIKGGIERLRLFQVASGGISYWPGEGDADEWASNYAGHFLLEAELKGFSLPAGYIDQWKKYQRSKALSYVSSNKTFDHPHGRESYELMQAYRLYTLALARSPELGSMNKLRENKNLSLTARWCLAAAYQLAGQPEAANQLTENLTTEVKDYEELDETYGSDERDKALILETLSLMGRRDKATPLMKELSNSLCSKEWMSTQTTAYTLLAMSKYIGKSGMKSSVNFSYTINNSAPQTVTSQMPMKQVDMKITGENGGTVSITNNGKGVLYARVVMTGIPKTGDPVSAQNNLEMKVDYRSQDGSALDVSKIKQGTDFYADVSITNPGLRGDYAQMALTQIFPSGWEILNTRLDNTGSSSSSSVPRYQDIRDDRVYTYFDLKSKETKTFRIYLNASYLGTYYLPTVYSEEMYDASINSRIAGKWVTVTREEVAKEVSLKK